ncbi:type II secretion system F family protein [Roseomonas xinghualingensis]|uniref:type II secretion system F family protein n=1 Tax=Roseomonas xinghualingensis TaxID=2986475 RepID=UPI0021F1612D|nr:type II secretion system F family protein [Roseomonas sp. SXEYE001]MCV4208696.1 type II secretion system F family protein [Roseomonas sp. SXEYE001]
MTLSALPPIVLAGIAGAGTLLLSLAAVFLLHREARQRDFSARIRQVTRPSVAGPRPASHALRPLIQALQRLGEVLRRTALFSERDLLGLERAVAAAGFNPHRAVSTFLGIKLVALLLLPVLGWFAAKLAGGGQGTLLFPAAGVVLGILVPGWVVRALRGPYVTALERGLPDALDLLVVCAESGLGLDSAVERVAREMEFSSPAIAVELALLSQELRMLPDRRDALARLGERTGVESFQRLSATLSQTIRYGTPLSQALRVLAAEMRQERMIRMEERAARLPALLVLPLVLFILPCLFIVLIGPSAIRIIEQMSGH